MTRLNKKTKYSEVLPYERLPRWIKPSIGRVSQLEKVQNLVKEYKLHTICEEGRCPNRGECYSSGTATFLIGGSICTRSCAFCQVDKGKSPLELDPMEAYRIAKAVKELKLNVPVIVRLEGTNAIEAKKILTDSKVDIIPADSIQDAANKAVNAALNN